MSARLVIGTAAAIIVLVGVCIGLLLSIDGVDTNPVSDTSGLECVTHGHSLVSTGISGIDVSSGGIVRVGVKRCVRCGVLIHAGHEPVEPIAAQSGPE